MWVFGYGSLMWKTQFPYEEKIIGYVKGFKRRFWQHSTDHRGIPGKPGRVVTLVKEENSKVWGVAYKVAESAAEEVKKHLDYREKGGYETFQTMFYPREKSVDPFNLMLYIGSPENPDYAGAADEKVIAKVIQESIGPSGPNLEYLLNLAQFVREHIPEDEDSHLFLLESLVKIMWVFGYGSLMWKTEFPYELRIIGHVKGFKRRFWQKSVKHRGTRTKPGRAVTLVKGKENEQVWGVAYKIAESAAKEVKKNLDIREGALGSYQAMFYPREKSVDPFNLMLYMGAPENPNYAGPQDEKVLAKIIQESVGPSGTNLEYLLNLAQFVREHIPEDEDSHLFLLESLVKSNA